MEACFLSPNSFTKIVEFPPLINPRILTHHYRNPTQSLCRKSRLRSPHLTGSNLGPGNVSPEPDEYPSVNADWRSFRARLVAGEADTVSDQLEPVKIGNKWAHAIHEPEKGCLLIATEKLDGVHIFEKTVVLLLSTGPIGPTGVILNRPSLMSIKEMRSPALNVSGSFSERPLFFGGPLEEGLFLVSPKKNEEGLVKSVFEEVMKGLYYGRKESVGCGAEMVKRGFMDVEDFRFFDGYCGWEKEQLKDEVMAGYWKVAACSPSVVGIQCVGSVELWDEVLALMAHNKVT